MDHCILVRKLELLLNIEASTCVLNICIFIIDYNVHKAHGSVRVGSRSFIAKDLVKM